MNAGCVFINETHILAGYQPHKEFPSINGIGGKAEDKEVEFITALREFLEEVLGLYNCVKGIRLLYSMEPRHIFKQERYTMFLFTFEDLENMLFILHINNIVSPLYLKFPLTISDLLFRRLPEKSEISHLCILPLVLHDDSIPFVEPYFVKDISKIIQRHSS
jgi:hypothetical protein